MSISSLGAGSGILTADVIDKLKTADESALVKPLENKITLNSQKKDAASLLTALMKTFKASVSALSYDTIFDKKDVTSSGSAVVSVETGANVSSFSLETTTLAKKDITQFGSFASSSEKIASGTGVFTIADNNGHSYDVSYDANTTLSQFAQSITDAAGSTIDASVLQTGTGAYNLILTSKATGANEQLTFTDTDDGSLGTGSLLNQLKPYDVATNVDGYKNIQPASDASFKYNGSTITRSTNEVSDLVVGLTINLKEEGDISNVQITQNTDDIVGEMQQLVDSFNTLSTNLTDMTSSNQETGATGIFNSNSFVRSIRNELTRSLTTLKNSDSIINYGIDIDRSGVMSFDSSVMSAKLSEDTDAVKLFFTGGTDSNGNEQTGLFADLDTTLKGYTGYGKLLSTLDESITTEASNLEKRRLSATKSLEAKYEILTRKFTAYDSIINKANNMFSSLQSMIDAQANASN